MAKENRNAAMAPSLIVSLLTSSFVAQASPQDQERKTLGIECSENYILVINPSQIAKFQMSGWRHQKLTPASYDPKFETVKYRMESKDSTLENLSLKSSYDISFNYKTGEFTIDGKVFDTGSGKELAHLAKRIVRKNILDQFYVEQNAMDAWYSNSGDVTLRTKVNGVEFKLDGKPFAESAYDSSKRGPAKVANFGINCNR